MKLTKKITEKDIPKWFKQKNYEDIPSFETEEFRTQLEFRAKVLNNIEYIARLLESTPELLDSPRRANSYDDYILLESIRQVNTTQTKWLFLSKKDYVGQIDLFGDDTNTEEEPYFKVIKSIKLDTYYDMKKELEELKCVEDKHYETYLKSPDYSRSELNRLCGIGAYGCESDNHDLTISINTKDYSDAQILIDLEKVLKNWRIKVGNKPDQKIYKKQSIKFIHKKHIFAWADLEIYLAINGLKLSKDNKMNVMSQQLGEYINSSTYKDTMEPLFHDVIFNNILIERLFNSEI